VAARHLTLRIATYNIHRCKGLDRRTDVHRLARVIAGLGIDVIAMQEVMGPGADGMGQAEEIAALLGMTPVMAPTRLLRGRPFGNAIIGRFPVRRHEQYDISWRDREPRACQRVDLDVGHAILHLFNVHLGTSLLERRKQALHLARILDTPSIGEPKIMLGDFNEWLRGPATRVLMERLDSLDLRTHLKRRRTYPGILPMLHLDHIYYRGRVDVTRVELCRTRTALIASDHLPLVAELKIRFEHHDKA
jgi:endonuclease/exonuclease/phosphatase family metal-dependent hydrolase